MDGRFHDAIPNLDILIYNNPTYGFLYYLRSYAYYFLSDMTASTEDLQKSKELGFKLKEEYEKFIVSRENQARVLSESLIEFDRLDPNNNYKKKFGLSDTLKGSLRQERTCYDVLFYDLTVRIDPKKRFISGNNIIHFKVVENTNRIQIDLARRLMIDGIEIKGNIIKYNRIHDAVFVSIENPLIKDSIYQISIDYKGKPKEALNPPWHGGFVWKKTRSKHHVGVACEHIGASCWWPCKDHLSDKPDSMLIDVQVPSKYQGISNGSLRKTYEIDDKYTSYEWFVSYPINTYNATFYLGDFVNFNELYTNDSSTYLLEYYVLPHNLKLAREYYKQTRKVVEVFEELYGEYPYKNDGMAMVEAPFAGMEHQSAIAIGSDYKNHGRWGLDDNSYDYLVVHELAHEWWGNTVTMSDMADAWISEGFATYSEFLFVEKIYGHESYIKANARNMWSIVDFWPVVGLYGVNDNTFLGGDIYNKGATMLHSLRCIVNNDTIFFDWIKDFYEEFSFKTIATKDFINYTNSYYDMDLTDFFNKYLHSIDPPVLEYEFELNDGHLELYYKWINVGDNFSMPFSLMINESVCYSIEGTTNRQKLEIDMVKDFAFSSYTNYNEKCIVKNSFTYFWTKWKR